MPDAFRLVALEPSRLKPLPIKILQQARTLMVRPFIRGSASPRHRLQHQAGEPCAVGAKGIAEHSHEYANRSETGMEGAGDHRCAGRAADIGL